MNPRIACNPSADSKRTLRTRLFATRVAAAADAATNDALARHVAALIARFAPRCIGFYWPLRGEFDARALIAAWLAADPQRRAALPVIHERHTPLDFLAWTPDMPMREGHHCIPEPATGQRALPDLLLVPCVGFDADGYRLGYGGGYYDRTLAAWPGATPPVTVGIAYEACRIETGLLAREAHDLPLDAIVTDAGSHLARHRASDLADHARTAQP
ncbi:MAG TPA: 5-formyltetrahydrofolate cyclo-ligase [Paraburkholderia sp.]|nr:5-formyltetrahydrofolate cyclo-ligase [Paraburkholderia sp.]